MRSLSFERSTELLQEAQVAVEEQAQVVDAVAQHGQPVRAHAGGKADAVVLREVGGHAAGDVDEVDISGFGHALQYLQGIAVVAGIVADGGFKNFDQIIKALALGADYVMLGSIFAKSQESLVGDNVSKKKYIHKKVIEREHFGMSTKKAQLIMGKSKDQLKTSEGISIMLPVEYKLATWVDNFKHYFREAMSLTNIKNIENFIGKPVIEHITPSAYFSYYK